VKQRQKLNRIGSLLLKPFVKARNLRSDEGGNVMLLTGMMAFLVTIFAVMAADTSQAIYNRIIAQNSVDAAADAAALWQARGCNMVQNENNWHCEANQFFATTEANALNACALAALLQACSYLPYIGAVCAALKAFPVCPACESAPIWDDAQNATAKAILTEQEWITTTIPYITLAAANDAAQGSGADELFTSASQWVNQSAASIGLPLPDLTDIGSALGNILAQFGLTVYALPLDPTSLELGVTNKVGKDSPWHFGPCRVEINIGETPVIGCGLDAPSLDLGPEKQYTVDTINGQQDNWGWYDDQYYAGQPGFMTWITGKTNQPTVLGLLRWLNPNPTPPAEIPYWMSQSDLPMYNGAVLSVSNLQIPAFIAFASSQVDGAPGTTWNGVVTNGPANAYPYLIPVYFPGFGPGTSIGIYH
jgi:hypothetical protein